MAKKLHIIALIAAMALPGCSFPGKAPDVPLVPTPPQLDQPTKEKLFRLEPDLSEGSTPPGSNFKDWGLGQRRQEAAVR